MLDSQMPCTLIGASFFLVCLVCFPLFIDLLTDTVQPLSRCVHCLGGNNVLGSVSGQERVADGGKVVFVVHVGGNRCVTWSIDRIVQRHVWIGC